MQTLNLSTLSYHFAGLRNSWRKATTHYVSYYDLCGGMYVVTIK